MLDFLQTVAGYLVVVLPILLLVVIASLLASIERHLIVGNQHRRQLLAGFQLPLESTQKRPAPVSPIVRPGRN